MKKLIFMVMVLVVAAVIYFVGCGVINKATAMKPDLEIRMVEQPSFSNTVRNW